MNARVLLVFVSAVLLLSKVRADEVDALKPDEPLAEISIPRFDEGLLVSVDFHNQRRLFVLDTGASHHLVDSSIIPPLGIPGKKVRVGTSGDPAELIHYQSRDLEVFGFPPLTLEAMPISVTKGIVSRDLKTVREASGRDITGIVGIEFLKNKVLQLDFDRRVIRVFGERIAPQPVWGDSIPLSFDKNTDLLWVHDACIGGQRASFILDTGSVHGITIVPSEFDRLTASGVMTPRGRVSTTSLAQHREVRAGRVSKFALGAHSHHNLIVKQGNRNHLGLEYLRRFTITVDVPRKRIFLTPSKMFDAPSKRDLSGLALHLIDGKVVVAGVEERSAAARADIRKSDLIVAFDGRDILDCDIVKVRRRLNSKPGQVIGLVIDRNSQLLEKVLTLQSVD